MKLRTLALAFAAGLAFAPAAMADCVDYDPASHKKAQAELLKNLPTAEQLGVPTLEGLTIIPERTADDPNCGSKPPYSRFYYTVNMTPLEMFTRYHPNIRRRTAPSGGKEYFENPVKGDDFFLTSGTRITMIGATKDKIDFIGITPTKPVGALTVESQPFSAREMADWTPWVGGPDGGRAWVPVAGYAGGGAPAASQQTAQQTSATQDTSQPVAQAPQTPPGCPPASSSSAGSSVGAEIGGAVLGGGFGRNLGGALGGALGGGKKKPANCP